MTKFSIKKRIKFVSAFVRYKVFITNLYGNHGFGAKNKEKMAIIETRLPKIDGVGIIADNAALSDGIIRLEDNSVPFKFIKMTDAVTFTHDVYNAGVAEIGRIILGTAVISPNTMYSISISLPNTVSFFGSDSSLNADTGESKAVYITRTYNVPSNSTADLIAFQAEFASRMQADLQAPFSTINGTAIDITACDATAGSFIVDLSNIPGATFVATTPNVLPVGIPSEVKRYVDGSLVTAASYDRYIVKYRKYIRHNAVKGNKVVKEDNLIIYSDTAVGMPAILSPILDGSYTPAADYLGIPAS